MASAASYPESPAPSFLFDLDGTLIDSVYQHVIAWRTALTRIGIDLSVWRIHRRIGMSGGLFVSALLRETGRSLSKEDIDALQQAHAAEYRAQMDSVTALPGASTEMMWAPGATRSSIVTVRKSLATAPSRSATSCNVASWQTDHSNLMGPPMVGDSAQRIGNQRRGAGVACDTSAALPCCPARR